MKSIDDAMRLRSQIFGAFEMAEWTADPQRRAAWLTFAIVGAGPTGVELAGQIGELAHRSLVREFRNFDPHGARILLFDAGPRILPTFPERLSARAAKALERLEPRAVAAVLNRAQIRGLDPAPLQAVEEYECGRRPQPAATVLSQMWS